MDLKELGTIIAKNAPLLGRTISSVNPMAGLIISLVAHFFDANPKNPEEIARKISSDPLADIKLKNIETENKETLFQCQLEDRKNARQREEDIVKATGKRDHVLDFIAFVVICGYFVMCAIISFCDLDQGKHDVIYMMIGQLTGGLIMVLSYYFGSNGK